MRAIVNFAKGGWYPRAQERLKISLKDCEIPQFYFTDESQFNSPTHQQNPYAFKLYAFEYLKKQGYTQILWVDASMWAVKDPTPCDRDWETKLWYFAVL